jgi:toxin ParE1/3/4
MAKVRWTQQATDDLEAITDFIASDSASYAKLFALDVLSVVERLSEFPFSGRIVPELGDPIIREIIFGNYRIVYRVNADIVQLLALYHCARLLDPSEIVDEGD